MKVALFLFQIEQEKDSKAYSPQFWELIDSSDKVRQLGM